MKDFRSSIKGVLKIVRMFRGRITVSVLIGMVRIAASLCFVWVCKALVDIATGVSDKPLNVHVGILACIMLLQLAGNIIAPYWENLTVIKAVNRLRFETFSHTLNSSWHGREEFHSADVLNRIQEDIRVVVDLVCVRIPDVIITLCQLAAASVFLAVMAPNLLGLLVVLMVVAVLGSKMFYKTLRLLTEKIRKLDSKSQQHIQENLQNRVLVLTLTGVSRVLEKLGLLQADIEKTYVTRLNYNAVARGFMGFGFMAGYATAFLWGVFGIRDGSVTYGMMTAFLQLVGQVQRPIAGLSRHIPAVIQSFTSEERLSELNDLKEDIKNEGEVLDRAPSLSFEGVSYAYPGQNENVLDNFTYTFPAGSLTVIMGPTGKGKSTLVRLAMGLLEPASGHISFSTGEVPDIPVSLRNFMYVPQGNSLMSGTIRDNLLMADASASEESIRHALYVADAGFVDDLPDGLDTVCGEDGTGLSEGQAQRIAIARALLHPGTVLVLDESTSALDGETEDRFLERLISEYRGRKTVLFISHRERVISYADAILTL